MILEKLWSCSAGGASHSPYVSYLLDIRSGFYKQCFITTWKYSNFFRWHNFILEKVWSCSAGTAAHGHQSSGLTPLLWCPILTVYSYLINKCTFIILKGILKGKTEVSILLQWGSCSACRLGAAALTPATAAKPNTYTHMKLTKVVYFYSKYFKGQNRSEYPSAGKQLQSLQIGKISSLWLSCELNRNMMLAVFIWNLDMIGLINISRFFFNSTQLRVPLWIYMKLVM